MWQPLDTWIVVVGALCAASCASIGNFLVLRRMAMLGDAISHAVLPGLVLAFLITGTRDPMMMLLGAAVVGLLTAFLTEFLHRVVKVDEGASMGIVFTTLFAIGLLLIVRYADSVELDPGCVLYGNIVFVSLDVMPLWGMEVPRPVVILTVMSVINLVAIMLFYKELKITSFDAQLADSLGFRSAAMRLLIMVLVATTTVAAFEVAGSILVVAFLVIPPATAWILTDRLGVMICLSLLLAVAAAVTGHIGALIIPGWVGAVDAPSAAMMATMSLAIFIVVMFLSPARGIVPMAFRRMGVRLHVIGEDYLGFLYRVDERQVVWSNSRSHFRKAVGCGVLAHAIAIGSLRRRGAISTRGRIDSLTDRGWRLGRSLVRSHRLWESYLQEHLAIPADHLHRPAMDLEHVTDAAMQEELARTIGHPDIDPHGRKVPGPSPDEPPIKTDQASHERRGGRE